MIEFRDGYYCVINTVDNSILVRCLNELHAQAVELQVREALANNVNSIQVTTIIDQDITGVQT